VSNEDVKIKAMCRVVRAGEAYEGKQALLYSPGISAETVGASRINLQIATIPPGGKSKAHLHEAHETAGYVLSGEFGLWYGESLQEHLVGRPGDFFYIPGGVPHQAYNLSQTEPVTTVLARTDPNEQESVVLLPEFDGLH